jgi:hypothetical protein
MLYLRGTRKLPLTLSADGSGILKWYVDASFGVHPNLRGHSGGGLTLGQGFPITGSTKQKLNTRSSTETEVVGADDFMPAICWTRYFLKAQGYHVIDNVLYQDNKSAMLLEKNGKASSTKRTKHINIRYFFITDRIANGEVSLKWCPTNEMIGDYMTKPLQGALFRKFRDLIMGVAPTTAPATSSDNPPASILRNSSNPSTSLFSKSVSFEKSDASRTTTRAPQRTRFSLVPSGTHRSVL